MASSNNVASSFLLVDEGGDGSDMLQAKVIPPKVKSTSRRAGLQRDPLVEGLADNGWLVTIGGKCDSKSETKQQKMDGSWNGPFRFQLAAGNNVDDPSSRVTSPVPKHFGRYAITKHLPTNDNVSPSEWWEIFFTDLPAGDTIIIDAHDDQGFAKATEKGKLKKERNELFRKVRKIEERQEEALRTIMQAMVARRKMYLMRIVSIFSPLVETQMPLPL
ncbi:hypothetical protein E4U19_005661 [Claviceps sp. Clav32 group G5]|nr:hypothetical protein E4U19_005661 [Claviceps sp. Clav32 group G5]KAG6048648.1 hypothetical protein E4U39_007153 [Claviceps sp. Clav50 group G5]